MSEKSPVEWVQVANILPLEDVRELPTGLWLEEMQLIFPDELKKDPYKGPMVKKSFATELYNRYYGLLGIDEEKFSNEHGRDYFESKWAAFERVKETRPNIAYVDVDEQRHVIDVQAFQNLSAPAPNPEKDTVTTQENPKTDDDLVRLGEVYEMLGHYVSVDDILSFAKKYPQAVYGAQWYKSIPPHYINSAFVSVSTYIHRDFLPQLKEHCAAKYPTYDSQNEFITASEIVDRYRLTKIIAANTIAHKIRSFSKIHPDAVKHIWRTTEKNTLIALNKKYLKEFLKFAGLAAVIPPRIAKQKKIDPTTPGYSTDPTLAPISDDEMDKVAWKLAAQKVSGLNKANESIFAEWSKIHKAKRSNAK